LLIASVRVLGDAETLFAIQCWGDVFPLQMRISDALLSSSPVVRVFSAKFCVMFFVFSVCVV
jgi:hypothetical protein